MKTTAPQLRLPSSYAELVAFHLPRPIRDAVAYRNTVEIVDALAGHSLSEDQEDYLELLSQLIEAYESSTVLPGKKVSGISALKFLLQEHNLSGDDLGRLLGIDRSAAFKILKNRRRLTVDHVKKLAEHFKVTSDLFLA